MAYNHGREDRKWRIWKEAEEKVLRECGVDEAVIEQIRTDDRADFNSNRRFYRWASDFGEYLEGMEDVEKQAEVRTVADLLDEIENETLYLALVTVDRRTLQIVLLKMQGYSTKEIAPLVHEIAEAVEGCCFFESIPLWAVTLIGGLFITVLSFIMIMSVYGRFFRLYLYTAIAPISLSTFAGEPSQNVGKSFIKSYAAVCLEGAVIVLVYIIFSLFASSPPAVNPDAAAVTMVMFTPDNPDFYLKRSFEKEYSAYGVPYIAEHCNPFEPSDNVIIYGHHMKNGTMFTRLMEYESQKFYEGHKTIRFDTLTKTADYEIVTVFKTTVYDDTGFKYYLFANAAEFSDMMAERMGWGGYGDKQYVSHVLRYYVFGRIPTGTSSQAIVQVALTQEGNSGDTYWSWYGFDSRVEWCACFVSWCAEQYGYLESGVIPKFSLCSDGVDWFNARGQFQDASYVPAAGDIIFFDWGNDGSIDHVGIVESVTNGVVNTIEGNSGDICARRSYSMGSDSIYGYSVPLY